MVDPELRAIVALLAAVARVLVGTSRLSPEEAAAIVAIGLAHGRRVGVR